MVKGVIVQKGSFNPLHRMHKRIADDAIKRYPEYKHCMQLSQITCDKGTIRVKELLDRAHAIKAAGYDCTITESGLFIDCIRETREVLGPEPKIVFPCGEDTIQRFFRDWEAFCDAHPEIDRYEYYKQEFQNVEWYVSKRESGDRKYQPIVDKYLGKHNNLVWSDLDLDDISSTRIRAGEVPNE